MVKVAQIYAENAAQGDPTVSFEIYPPRTPEDEAKLYEKTIPKLVELKPAFITVTYGAGGSTRTKTLEIAAKVAAITGLPVASHLACLGSRPEEVRDYLGRARDAGIENLVAIRGDPPRNQPDWRPPPETMRYGIELVRVIRENGGARWGIVVGGYPEGHPASADGKEADWRRLREKVDAGADAVATQLFFDNRDWAEFSDYLWRSGVRVPVVPGVLPVLSTAQIKRFASFCGAKLPPIFVERLEANAADEEAVRRLGIDWAAEQCRELLDLGVPGFHFYTLNKARSVRAILEKLGLR